jgi:DNA integrity scanning protein DisA with diadenylate cyclase activity
MKESARAARDEIAHNRCVAALEQLAGEDAARELKEIRSRRLPPAVASTYELEVMAGILEGLVAGAGASTTDYPLSPLDQDVVDALAGAGYARLEDVRGASDEDLLAIKGIGPAKLKEIRGAVG